MPDTLLTFSGSAGPSLPSAAADGPRGAPLAPHTAIEPESTTAEPADAPTWVSRVVRVPLERPTAPVGRTPPKVPARRDRAGELRPATPADIAWAELVALGREAAAFANGIMAGW